MTKEEIIDNLELYTVGRPKKDRVSITVEELQSLIDEIKALEQQPTTQEILSHIETGITATGQSDSYCVGFCNALVWLKSCITHEEPQFFEDTQLPPVTPTQNWIPIITREPTEEEKEDYFEQNGEELCYMIDSPMPDNGQKVLVSVGDTVGEDIFDEDFWNFEGWDIVDVEAWMPMPSSYQGKQGSKNENIN